MSSLFGELIWGGTLLSPRWRDPVIGKRGCEWLNLARSVRQVLCIESTGNNESDGVTLFYWQTNKTSGDGGITRNTKGRR